MASLAQIEAALRNADAAGDGAAASALAGEYQRLQSQQQPLLREPQSTELDYFKSNPHVGGMAADDNRVILNPYASGINKEAVYKNEAARLTMRKGGTPSFDITPKQREFFSGVNNGKPYGTDEDIRATIIGRIISGDPSAQDATPEQRAAAKQVEAAMGMAGQQLSPAQLPEVPPAVRAMVGMTNRPEHRMTILRQFFPKAIITPSDEDGSNYTIDDPTMGRLQYNTPGTFGETAPSGGGLAGAVAGSPSLVGDLASIGSEAGEMLGGTVGAVAGARGGPMGSAAGAGLGAVAGQELFRQVAAPLLEGAMGVTMPDRTLGEMGADAGTTALLNAGGQLGGELLGRAGKWAAKAIFRGGQEGGRQFSQAVTDANKWGVPISVGQASDNAWGVFDAMAGTQARHFRLQTEKAVGEQVRKMSQTIGKGRGLTAASVGQKIKQGVEDYNVAFRGRGHDLDQEFFDLVPPTSSVPTPNTMAAIQRIMPNMPSMPSTEAAAQAAPLGQRMTRLLKDIQDGGGALNFNDMRTYRRQIGEMMDAGGLGQVPDIPFIQLKDLHGALTDDMEGLARANGPAAEMAFKRSQAYWAKELTTMQDVIRPIVAKNVPSDIARALEGKMKDAPEYVREIMDTLSKDQRDVIRAATIRKLGQVPKAGQATGETWSFDKFLADWGGLDRTVRNTIFKDTGYLADLDALARTAERLGKAKKAGGEPPVPKYMIAGAVGAPVLAGLGLTAGVAPWLTLPVGFVLTSMGAAGGQNLMRNRNFVHWLAQAVQTSPNGMSAHMGRLGAIAKNSDPQTRDDIKTFMEGLTTSE